MPTENRSSNTEMVSFPRELSDDLAELIAHRARVCGGGAFEIWEAICEGFGQAVTQPHPEPIAWMVGTAFWWTKEEAERDAAAMGLPVVGLGPMTGSAPAEQHQGEPVAYAVFTDNGNIRIWSTNCAAVAIKVMQEEGKQVVPLYAHSAPSATAEVERLRTELDLRTQEREKFLGWCRDARAESTKLRAQLAERDALLQEIRRKPGLFSGDFILRLDETLSASAEPRPFRTPDCPDCACVQDGQCLCSPSKPSAEPSAPVEIDERADFERHVILTTGRPIDSELKRHPVRHDEYECRTMQTRWNDWQARAALDRKPS